MFCFYFIEKIPFEFVFLVPLRTVNRNTSLPEIIIAEHDQLDHTDAKTIKAILKGDTKHEVLLLFDGYDEYIPGTNQEVDTVIQSSVGNCFLLLTSRIENGKMKFVSRQIRDKMDYEVRIEGLSAESIERYCSRHLGKKGSREVYDLLSRAKMISGFYELPLLLMGMTLYTETNSLPHSLTATYKKFHEIIMHRTSLKFYGCRPQEIPNISDMMFTLGKLAWEALQKDRRQCLLSMVFTTIYL